MPEMNLARWDHSSCILEKTLYILGGYDENDELTNSIEILINIDEPDPSVITKWSLIQLISSFQPRNFSVFCAWNEHEIIILGGKNENREIMCDGWVFDTRTDTLR